MSNSRKLSSENLKLTLTERCYAIPNELEIHCFYVSQSYIVKLLHTGLLVYIVKLQYTDIPHEKNITYMKNNTSVHQYNAQWWDPNGIL